MGAVTGTRVRQLLLLCALACSVIGMHHVALAPHEDTSTGTHAAAAMAPHAESPAEHSPAEPGTDGEHGLLHLCLAVLSATGGLLLVMLLLMVVSGRIDTLPGRPRPPTWHSSRFRGTAGRSLLASVGVLRI